MRSYRVYGIRSGGNEEYVDTAHSPAEGMEIHRLMKSQGHFDEMVVRDVLGGKHMHRNLHTEENLMSAA